MTRSDFIKGIIGLFGIAALPKGIVTQYRKFYLLQSFVRGFKFYEGTTLLAAMHKGDMLELVREPDNDHDACAIALHFNNRKIGYIPREENEILSRLMDARVIELMAEITHLEPQAATWENVHIAVYVLKKLHGSSLSKDVAYLAVLDTPHYRTLKYKNDYVARIDYEEDEVYDGESFYDQLVAHSQNDEVYNLIHAGFSTPHAMDEAVKETRLVINEKRLPEYLKIDPVTRALDEGMVRLGDYFDDDGYVAANVNRLAELPPRIRQFSEIMDKQGRRFFEVIFKK